MEIPKEIVEKSFEDKLNLAGLLSFRISEILITDEFKGYELDEDMDNIVWGYADGLKQQRIYNNMNGRTSLSSMVKFDMEQEEQQIENEIVWLQELTEKLKKEVKHD